MDKLSEKGCIFLFLFILKKILYISFLLLLVLYNAQAQLNYHITTNQGLGTNMLSTIIRDRNNYMWICSYNGLFKHEGSGIRVFKKMRGADKSISSEEMHGLFEDRYGFIWIGTTAGVDKIDPVTGKVIHYYLKNPDNNSSYVGYIYAVFQDNKDDMWIATNAALFRINYQTGKFTTVPERKDEKGMPSTFMGYRPAVETKAGMWMGTSDGLVFYEYSTQKFYHRYYNPQQQAVFNLPAPFKKSNGNSSEITTDSKGNLYFIVDDDKLGRYNMETKQVDSFRFTYPVDAWRCCLSLAADNFDNIWIGFRHGGVLVFNKNTTDFISIQKQPVNSLISSNYISSIVKDYQGRMWVTTDNGLHIIDLYNKAIQQVVLSNLPEFEQLKYQSGIATIDKNDNLYIPYLAGGIFKYNANSQLVQYTPPVDSAIYKSSFVFTESDNSLLVGTKNSLLKISSLQPANNTWQKVPNLTDSLHKTNGRIAWMYKHSDNSYYIKKFTGEWYHINGKQIEQFSGDGFMKLGCVSKDSLSLWYITETANLARRQLNTGQTDTVFLQKLLKQSNFSFANPRDLADDGNGSIWITSQNGLLRYNIKEGTLVTYSSSDGLSHSFTYALHADASGGVWVASIGGIDYYQPGSNSFRNITGFTASKYMDAFGSSVATSDGRICFITGNKIWIINPSLFFAQQQESKVVRIHEMRINDIPVNWNDSTMLMQLPWKKNRLLFRFGLLDYNPQGNVQYAYKLDGLQQDWVDNESRNEIQFNVLSPGKYTLHIRATATADNNKQYFYQLSFHIKPPFWQTWWFRMLIFSIIALLLFLFYKRRINNLKAKSAIKQQMAELEGKAIRAQMNPHFIFNSLNAIQESIVTEKIDAAYDYLSQFSKLLRMVLDNSDKNLIPLNSELETIRLYLSLEALRFSQSFSYTIENSDKLDNEDIYIPSLLLQPFVENAIWHGLINKEGEKLLQIRFSENDGKLQCVIEDNGVGRARAAQIKEQKLGAARFASKGTKLAMQRIEILNRERPGSASIETIDLMDEAGKGAGTKVVITLANDYNNSKNIHLD